MWIKASKTSASTIKASNKTSKGNTSREEEEEEKEATLLKLEKKRAA